MTESSLTRRTALKGLGAAALTGAGAYLAVNPAAAQASISIDITGTSISNDGGDVDWVGVEAVKNVLWDGFDVPVRYIGFKHEITIKDGGATGWHPLYPNTVSGRLPDGWSSKGSGGDGWGGPGEYVVSYTGDKQDGTEGEVRADIKWAVISDGSHPSDWDSVQNPAAWASNLSVDEDGVNKTRTVKMRTTLTFYAEDADGNPVQVASADGIPEVQGTDSFDVDVTNEGGTTSGTSSTGNTTAK